MTGDQLKPGAVEPLVQTDNIAPNMFPVGNASLSMLSVTENGERGLMKLKDTSHLKQQGEQDSFLV